MGCLSAGHWGILWYCCKPCEVAAECGPEDPGLRLAEPAANSGWYHTHATLSNLPPRLSAQASHKLSSPILCLSRPTSYRDSRDNAPL